MIGALREVFPTVEERFRTKAGLTGPVQLVGRDGVDDERRLRLEIFYSAICAESYSARLDFIIALNTALICLGLRRKFTIDAVEQLAERYAGASQRAATPAREPASAVLELLDEYLMQPRSRESDTSTRTLTRKKTASA